MILCIPITSNTTSSGHDCTVEGSCSWHVAVWATTHFGSFRVGLNSQSVFGVAVTRCAQMMYCFCYRECMSRRCCKTGLSVPTRSELILAIGLSWPFVSESKGNAIWLLSTVVPMYPTGVEIHGGIPKPALMSIPSYSLSSPHQTTT
jgi:hypothetical protein